MTALVCAGAPPSSAAAARAAASSRSRWPSIRGGCASSQPGPAIAPAAQPRVGRAHHVAQAVGRVRGHHLEALGLLALPHERAERPVEGVGGDALRLHLVEHPEVGIDPGAQGVRAKDARAEAVDGRDPRALGGAGVGGAPELEKAPAHPDLQLGRRLLGEGDGEHPLHRRPILGHGLHEALDQHRGLARARPGPDHQRTVAPSHGPRLLGGQLRAHPSHRQIEG